MAWVTESEAAASRRMVVSMEECSRCGSRRLDDCSAPLEYWPELGAIPARSCRDCGLMVQAAVASNEFERDHATLARQARRFDDPRNMPAYNGYEVRSF